MSKLIKMNLLCFAALLLLAACVNTNDSTDPKSDVTASDAPGASDVSEVSSMEPNITPENAVRIYAGENELTDIFILEYHWNGNDYKNEATLNRIMMEKYALNRKNIPGAVSGCELAFCFQTEIPEKTLINRYGNTTASLSGALQTVNEYYPETDDMQSNRLFWKLDYGKYSMNYFTLECEWNNGNSVTYAFALKNGNK